MPQNVTVYRCMVISPSDVQEERDAIADVIDQWNGTVGRELNIRVEAVRWEQHGVPDLAARGQQVINKQLVDSADFGVAVFWAKLGTPTGGHESGSAEEIARLLSRGARVLVYRKTPSPARVTQGR